MIIFELDLDFKYPSTKQLNFIDELESIGIKLKSVSSASKVYFDNVEIDPSKTITIANPVSGTHYFKNDLGTQIKCVFIAKNSSVNFEPGKPDLSNYYTKPETDEAIAEAIEGIDFPEQEIPETSTIPQKNGMEGNCVISYTPSGIEVDPYEQPESSYEQTNVLGGSNAVVVYTEPTIGLLIKDYDGTETLFTDGQTFNFPNKLLLSEIYVAEGTAPANEIVRNDDITIVDGYVFRSLTTIIQNVVIENIRGFINKDTLGTIPQLLVKNCGILACPRPFEGITHLVVDGEIKYISNLLFSVRDSSSACVNMTFVGKGLLNAELLVMDINSAGLSPADQVNPLVIQFPDITFNEFVDWCGDNAMGLYRLYDDFFNSSAIAKLVFKDQTLTDVNQTKLDNSYAKVIATLEDGTALPLRTSGEYDGWVQLAKDATTLEIDSIGNILTLNDANIFKNYNFNSVKEVINKVDIAYAFNYALDKESATEQAYLAPDVDIKDAYLDSCGATGTLFNENRVIQNVYFKGIPSANDVETALGTQNADAKIYFAGVLAAVYSGFYHELTWKNGFGPTAV